MKTPIQLLASALIALQGLTAGVAVHASTMTLQDIEKATEQEVTRVCNESETYTQLCRKFETYATFIGVPDLATYLHFVAVYNLDRQAQQSIISVPKMSESDLYEQALAYMAEGQAIPAALESELQQLVAQRQQVIAATFGLDVRSLQRVFDNYELLSNFISLDKAAHSSAPAPPSEPIVINVAFNEVSNWHSPATRLVAATSLIESFGIEHIQLQPLTIRIEIDEAPVPTFYTFNYTQPTGALPSHSSW